MKVRFSSFPKNGFTAWFDPQTKKLEYIVVIKGLTVLELGGTLNHGCNLRYLGTLMSKISYQWRLSISFSLCRRFSQIVNCCRYFVNQSEKGLVTLLTGSVSYESPKRGQRRRLASSGTQATPEAVELARSCGVTVESLRVFCSRFSNQAKSVT